jgi:DNA polymerase-3 subunit gamma/tau
MATQGKYRVYIIDEVHMLSTAAFNALLKTLEEPPPHVLFIFATTEIHKVPPTILSRCQRFDFKKIPSTVMTANLRSICSQEKIQIDDNSLKAIANESEGCLRDAQSLLDQAIAICGQNIELESLEKALGFVSRKQFFNLIEAIFNHDASLALKSSSTLMESGIDPKILLNRLTLFFRDLHFYFWTSHSAIDDAYTLEMMEKGRSTLSADEIIRALDLCLKTQTQLPLSSLASFALESLVAKLSLQRPAFLENNIAKSPATSAHAYSNNEQKPSLNFSNNAAKITQQVNSVASSNPQAAPSTTSDSTSLVSNVKISAEPLSQLEEYLRNQKSSWLPVLKSILSLDCSAEKVQVSVKADFAGKRLASKDGVELLKQVFSNPRVHVQVAESSDALRNNNRPEDIIQDKRRESREHVAVQEAIKAFKAVVKETKVLNDEKTK